MTLKSRGSEGIEIEICLRKEGMSGGVSGFGFVALLRSAESKSRALSLGYGLTSSARDDRYEERQRFMTLGRMLGIAVSKFRVSGGRVEVQQSGRIARQGG